jgi:hypothetical protein
MCNSAVDTLCLAALEKQYGVSIDGYVLTLLDSVILLLTYCGIGAAFGPTLYRVVLSTISGRPSAFP